jgi:threonine/homoserine/homoserine lactone efflux protein
MNDITPIVLRALTLGLTAGLLPGALQTVLIQKTLAQGWRRAIIGILAPLLSDLPLIVIVLLLFSQFPPVVVQIIRIAGGIFLLYLAWGSLRNWRRGGTIGDGPATDVRDESDLRFLGRMALVSLLSPGPYIFWGTVNGPLLRQGLDISPLGGLAFLLAFYVPFLFVLGGWVIVFDRLRTLNPRITRGLVLITIIVLAVLGFQLVLQGLGLIA